MASKALSFLLFTWVLVGCGVGAPSIKFATEDLVTVGHFNTGIRPVLTPQARDLAARHCEKHGKTARYTGTVRDSGVGPEEFDFECVEKSERGGQNRSDQPPSRSTGSGFIISISGYLLTNAHVVDDCASMFAHKGRQNRFEVTLVESDSANDIALLKVNSDHLNSDEYRGVIDQMTTSRVPVLGAGLFRASDVDLGEEILVAGFPFGDFFSGSLKVTSGIVSSRTGIGDNAGEFQIDAAVQNGNSGGPVYDQSGNLVGIVVAQLNKIKVAQITGSIPENVNFGIKGSTVRQFLSVAGLKTTTSNKLEPLSTKELAAVAEKQTVLIECAIQK